MNKKFADVYNLTSKEVGVYPYSWLLDIYTYKVDKVNFKFGKTTKRMLMSL